MSRRIVIIGGAGYVGGVVTAHLLSEGFAVTCFDSLLYENEGVVLPYLGNPRYRFVYGDLRNREALDRALEGADDVVLLAGLVGDPITKAYPELSQSINHTGMIDCVDHLGTKELGRLIFVSTCSNYGLISEDDRAGETYALNPLSLYAKSKVAVEEHIMAQEGRVDYAPTVLRFATAFGLSPRMRFDLTVNQFTLEMARGHDLLVFDAHTWRPYCHVQDFSRLIQLVLEAPAADVTFEVFNAGADDNNFTKQEIVDTIAEFVSAETVSYKEHGTDPRNYRVDFRKVREVLGFEPEFSVRDGVVELLGAIDERLFDRVEERPNFYGNYEPRLSE